LAIVLLSSVNVLAQSKNDIKTEKKARKDSTRQSKIDQGKFIISHIIVPAYTPELGGLIAAGGLISFKNNPDDKITQRSTLPVTFALSTTGAVVFQGHLL